VIVAVEGWIELNYQMDWRLREASFHCNLWELLFIANWVRPIVESPIPKTANTLAVLNATFSQCFSALTAPELKPTRIGLLRRRTKIILSLNCFWWRRLLQRKAWDDPNFSTAAFQVLLPPDLFTPQKLSSRKNYLILYTIGKLNSSKIFTPFPPLY
jgi:hypothetical protein